MLSRPAGRPLAPGRLRVVLLVAMFALSSCTPNRFVTGWIPWWGPNDGTKATSDAQATNLFGEVSLFWYGTRTDGSIALNTPNGSTTSLNTTVASLRAKGLPIVPTIADGTAAGTMSTILANATKRTAHVTNIVNLVVNKNYDGIDIDYEVFAFSQRTQWTTIKPNWVAFVRELATALHARGKVLSVTVPAVWNGGSAGYTVYAQTEIAASVDRLRLMVYDWSVGTPGPIAPIYWVNDVITYSTAIVPASKLQLGVPAYGRHWAVKKNASDVCPASATFRDAITMSEVLPLAAAHGVVPTRGPSGELTFTWTDGDPGAQVVTSPPPALPPPGTTVPRVGDSASGAPEQAKRIVPKPPIVKCPIVHTVYAPDAYSVRQRADAALAAGWSGISIWALGYEIPEVYDSLAGIASQRPGGAPSTTTTAPTISAGTATIKGVAYHPEFDLPVPVQFRLTKNGVDVVAPSVVLSRETSASVPAGIGPFHGFTATYPLLAAGTYQFCATQLAWGGTPSAASCRTFTV